jgi:hypothetical protein
MATILRVNKTPFILIKTYIDEIPLFLHDSRPVGYYK